MNQSETSPQAPDGGQLVTIGLPVSTQEKYFAPAVRSIFAQSYQNWELIIVLDGAPNTIEKQALAITDQRVRVIRHSVNLGLAASLNEISESANGELVARMDSDDIMHPDRIRRQVDLFAASPSVDVLGGRAMVIDEMNTVVGQFREPKLPSSDAEFFRSNALTHPTVMFRRRWALANPYDPLYLRGEDKELWMRSRRETGFAKSEEVLMFYRISRALDVGKQRKSGLYDRMLFLEYGPDILGSTRTRYRILKLSIKSWIFRVAAVMGADSLMYARHLEPTDVSTQSSAKASFEQAISGAVAGW
jgi:glycosyltransferase involved in cell wall biosynthesis